MKKCTLCLLLGLLLVGTVWAQPLTLPYKVEAIALEFLFLNGNAGEVSFPELESKTRFGNLLTPPPANYQDSGTFSSFSFNISVRLVPRDSIPHRHEISMNLATEVVEMNWFEGSTDSSLYRLSSELQYFRISVGYHYKIKKGRIFRIRAGTIFGYGIPISAVTAEELKSPGFDQIEHTKLFGHKGGSLRLSFPLTLELRLFRQVNFLVGYTVGPAYYKINRVSMWMLTHGAELGFRFNLR